MGIRSVLEANFDFEIIDEFLDHYAMMTEIMESLIVDLGNPERFHRSIEELFRIFHNIKSASGYLQIEPMVRLATFSEDALEQLRSRDTIVNDETITWLISVADMFMQWQEDLKMDNELSKIHFSLLILPDMERA
ncbi:MAG: chemotaxis protein CheA [Sulfuricurvum sp. GWF2_44_89]|jgi:two-component system chemotaxis sensor kinase CheA|uniref:Chemotaxis protein CheA n=1 Tax=Sulfuricurvum kujiense TaxID=148813 RepID=A0A2D3WHG4_9BACT|nr:MULTISPECIES: Hpt domain-containing protein [Sulfuricurvum]OHD79438.1 MAG: chemotaxis protein CheA [Sulfuricurvum sp. GWF2_44_89]OHD92019.1 MAG: chemotaxis protein CheA [Sulfuricurvum sp. RIFOXYD12_FULL_44_77]OHD93246.1 MAG: chemotaxis protein CheA [Sulfuricurvum sp. RIFOXYD2_FULL_44_160]DAB39335.1 MAG TPA: chemotaxis protein CheA [Sulfuricurvum kujiense]